METLSRLIVFGLLFITTQTFAETYTWIDEEGKKHITNLPAKCYKTENGPRVISPDCIPEPRNTARKKESSKGDAELEKNRKEYAKLNKYKHTLNNQLRNISEDIRKQEQLIRRLPDDIALKGTLKTKYEKRAELKYENSRVIERMEYLLLQNPLVMYGSD